MSEAARTPHALDGLDLEVPQSIVIVLFGPNGAGKTTDVKVLATLTQPTAVSARIDGIDVLARPKRIRAIIGVSGQSVAVDENLTDFENLVVVGRLDHLGATQVQVRVQAQELITLFDLEEAKNRPVKGFCGGMRRRIDLAGAPATCPKALFLDEATTGLDPRNRLGMSDIITGLVLESKVSQGTTVLLTTQYLEEADQLTDSTSVIDNGRVMAKGTSDELKASIGDQRVEITLVDSGDSATTVEVQRWKYNGGSTTVRVLRRFGDSEPTTKAEGRELAVTASDAPAALQGILAELGSCGIRLFDAGMRRPTLDDVFLRLTSHSASAETGETSDAVPTKKMKRAVKKEEEPLMTTTNTGSGSALSHWFSDSRIITRRNLIKIKSVPDILEFTTLQPIMFLLLYTYVDAGVINIPGSSYKEFIMASIFAQTIVSGCTYSGSAMAQDLKDGIIDKFRTLPMSPSAVLGAARAPSVPIASEPGGYSHIRWLA